EIGKRHADTSHPVLFPAFERPVVDESSRPARSPEIVRLVRRRIESDFVCALHVYTLNTSGNICRGFSSLDLSPHNSTSSPRHAIGESSKLLFIILATGQLYIQASVISQPKSADVLSRFSWYSLHTKSTTLSVWQRMTSRFWPLE